MKKLLIGLVLIIVTMQLGVTGLPPTTLNSLLETVKNTTFNFFVPNRQATKIAGGTLIETGNLNLLANPSFEHSTVDSSWPVLGTVGTETTLVQDGKKALSVSRGTSGAIAVDQDSTINAAQYDKQQGLAYCRVRSSFTGNVEICARANGADVAGACIQVNTDAAYTLYEIPFIMGGTSNGVGIKSTSNGTGTVLVDDCYVGIIKPGMITETGAVGPWIPYTPTLQGFGTTTPATNQCRHRVSGSSVDIDCRFALGTPVASEARVGLPNSYISDGSAVIPAIIPKGVWFRGGSSFSTKGGTVLIEPSVGHLTFSTDGVFSSVSMNPLAKANGNAMGVSGDIISFFASVPIAGLNSRVSLYSQQCKKPTDCENVFSAKVSSTGVVSGENLDWINGNAAITSTSTYTITFNTGVFTVAPNCSVVARNTAARSARIHTAATASSIVVRTQTPGTDTADTSDFEIICQKQGVDYKERNMITGSFEGIEKCADPYECTDTFSAYVDSAAAISRENIDWLSTGSKGGTGNYTVNFNSGIFTQIPNCTLTPGAISSSVGTHASILSLSTSSINYIVTNEGGTEVDSVVIVSCQKQGVDFRPKTAVAGTFIDSVVSPGAGKPALCSAKISSTGVISGQIGGCFASCTNATTPVCTFTTNYWVSGSVPNCWHRATTGWFLANATTTTTTFQGVLWSSGAVASSGDREYFCHGIRQ